MSEFTPIETQEAFDEAIKGRLARQTEKHTAEIAAIKEGFADYEDIKKANAEYAERIKTIEDGTAKASEKIKGYEATIAEQNERIKAFELNALKSRVAAECGLSQQHIEFLNGETEDALREQAEKLAKLSPNHVESPLAGESLNNGVDGVTAYFKNLNPNLKI